MVEPSASVPVAGVAAVPPVRDESAEVTAVPSHVAACGALLGQAASLEENCPLAQVYVRVAAVPPTVAAWVQVKTMVEPSASVPVAGVAAVPPVRDESAEVTAVPSHVAACGALLGQAASLEENCPLAQVYVRVAGPTYSRCVGAGKD